MNWSLSKCLICCILFLLFISYSTWTLTLWRWHVVSWFLSSPWLTSSGFLFPHWWSFDVVWAGSGFPPLPLHAWGNHSTCLQWSHREPLLLWTLLNHLVSEALALSTRVLLQRYLPCVFLCTDHAWIPSLEADWVVRECIELKRVGSLEAHSPCML